MLTIIELKFTRICSNLRIWNILLKILPGEPAKLHISDFETKKRTLIIKLLVITWRGVMIFVLLHPTYHGSWKLFLFFTIDYWDNPLTYIQISFIKTVFLQFTNKEVMRNTLASFFKFPLSILEQPKEIILFVMSFSKST